MAGQPSLVRSAQERVRHVLDIPEVMYSDNPLKITYKYSRRVQSSEASQTYILRQISQHLQRKLTNLILEGSTMSCWRARDMPRLALLRYALFRGWLVPSGPCDPTTSREEGASSETSTVGPPATEGSTSWPVAGPLVGHD